MGESGKQQATQEAVLHIMLRQKIGEEEVVVV